MCSSSCSCRLVGGPGDVTAGEDVQATVVVGVQERHGSPELVLARQSRLDAHVDETIVPVVEQVVGADARDVEISIAVTVEVPGGATHAVGLQIESGLTGDVTESQASEVLVKLLGRRSAGLAFEARAVEEEQIEPVVTVVVEDDDAGAHRLREPFETEGTRVVSEVDAAVRGDVDEADLLGAVGGQREEKQAGDERGKSVEARASHRGGRIADIRLAAEGASARSPEGIGRSAPGR